MARPNKLLFMAFDIRNIIGTLLAIYGVILVVAGLAPGLLPAHDDTASAGNRADLYIGTDANWWVGLGLLGVAAIFIIWALLRPVRPADVEAAAPDSR